jgi:hypothetical protein
VLNEQAKLLECYETTTVLLARVNYDQAMQWKVTN